MATTQTRWISVWSSRKLGKSLRVRAWSEGELELRFVGFCETDPPSDPIARPFRVPRPWLSSIARHIGTEPDDVVGGLRRRIRHVDDAKDLGRWLVRTDWYRRNDDSAEALAVIDGQLAGRRRPNFPTRTLSRSTRQRVLRREIERAFQAGDAFFLNAIDHAYRIAAARVAGVPFDRLTFEMCRWAYPEIGPDETWSIEDWDLGRAPPCEEDSAMAFGGGIESASITSGASVWSFRIGRRDWWFGDDNLCWGYHPASDRGLLAALQEATEVLGAGDPDDFELDGVSDRVCQRWERWMARR